MSLKSVEEYASEHGSIILRSKRRLAVGKPILRSTINNGRGVMMAQPVFVVREATAAEFYAQDPDLTTPTETRFYYEVRTD